MISLSLVKQQQVTTDDSNTVSDDEFPLIKRIISGDRDDYRILVERYQNMIFSLLMRQIGNPSVAEEIAHESFIRAFEKLKQFRFDSKFSTWLTRIAINQLSNYFASKAYRKSLNTTQLESHHDRPSNEHEQRETLSTLQIGISKLTQTLQKVIILCGVEGRSYEEVAQILEIPIGTVRSRLNQARLTLRTELAKIEKGDES